MYTIDFDKPGRVHFIGIGGISMSGLAELLIERGFDISGSDKNTSAITEHLSKLGATVYDNQTPDNISDDIDFIVYTAAIKPDNPEYADAKNRSIPMMERATLLGQVMKQYRTSIAIAGTHGKTTATSIASHILLSAGLDPTISVGGILPAIDGNIRIGGGDDFILEACEYTNSFLKFFPTIGIILNIEEDHMDFFHDIGEIRTSFHNFAKLIPPDGTLIINSDIDAVDEITDGLLCHIITYGMSDDADYTAKDISYDEYGCGMFGAYAYGKKFGDFSLKIPGYHNILNTLACLALAGIKNISNEDIQNALDLFRGTDRRFEKKGEINGFTIIDDYAHHPTEIRATLDSAKRYPHNEIWTVFQPHTYSRTKAFLSEFADALSMSDHVILTDIYAAREADPGDISSADIKEKLEKLGTDVYYAGSFDDAENFIKKNLADGDMLITMGAGDVVCIGEHLLKR